MKQYKVVPFYKGCFSGTIDPQKLNDALNTEAQAGWKFAKSIHDVKKTFGGVAAREVHFLIFEKDV